MSIAKKIMIGGIFLCAAMGLAPVGAEPGASKRGLITDEEAALFRVPENHKVIPSTVRAPGPRIDVESPRLTHRDGQDIAETDGEADLLAHFLKTREDVDLDKLEIELRNGTRYLSLTERLRPYLQQNRLEARHFYMPPGNFEIAIRIEDKKGRPAEKSYLWVVRN